MDREPRAGERVFWQSHGGVARGKVVRKLTSRTTIGAHTVAASSEHPEFLVETDEGKRAAHRKEALSAEG